MNYILAKAVNETGGGKPLAGSGGTKGQEKERGRGAVDSYRNLEIGSVQHGVALSGMRIRTRGGNLFCTPFSCVIVASLVGDSSYSWRGKRPKATPRSRGWTRHPPVPCALSWMHGFP
ncbi:UNVERIFIED_CONTAM: hypothetical protein K2H54_024218 [Gekko kuhli]